MRNPATLTSRLAATAALVLSLAAGPTLAVEPFKADYQANYMGLQANAQMSLAADGQNRWTYVLDIRGAGARLTQSTTFEAAGEQWRPLSSTDTQRGESGLGAMLVKNRSSRATYDWGRSEARWTGDVKAEESGPVRLQAGDVDGMLLNLALVRDVAAKRPLSYRLVEDGRAKNQAYQRAGTENITVAGKEHRAVKVVRTDGSRQITAWIVEGLPVPARILQQRNGQDQIDLRLRSLQ